MIASVEKIFDRQLNLGALARATTIAELAEVLQQGKNNGEVRSLVAIRATGRKPPLYCVHGVGGHILPFLDLAKQLGDEQPVYGLQAKPVRDGAQRTIKGLAMEYVEEVERFQPEGPYFLAGYSFGGFVAYEMARLLEAKGEEVALLALFDTQAGALPGYRRSLSRIEFARYRVRAFVERTLFRLSEMEFTSVILNQSSKVGSVNKEEMILGDIDIDTVPGHLRNIMAANQAALSHYVPGRFCGLITLFKSSYYGRGVYYGWRDLTSGGVEIFEVPGTHRGMMQEPNVRILADYLKLCIAARLDDSKA
jgi:thioesterase domain-containing protein